MTEINFIDVKDDKEIVLLAELARVIWEDHYTPIIGEEQVEYMLEKFQSPNAIKKQIEGGYRYFIIYYAGDLAGYVGFCPDRDSRKLFLSKFYILAKYRGLGLGRKAMSFVENSARETDMNKIWLTVNKYNSNSIAVYEKMGFVKTSDIVQDIGRGYVMDDFVLEKNI